MAHEEFDEVGYRNKLIEAGISPEAAIEVAQKTAAAKRESRAGAVMANVPTNELGTQNNADILLSLWVFLNKRRKSSTELGN